MNLGLNGKSAIVTGGSRGIGFSVATTLAAEGADVALAGRDLAALERVAATIASGQNVTVLPVTVDTTDDSSVRAMVARVAAEFGGVDILVNGAATAAGGPAPGLAALTDAEMREQFETKVLGYLRCARAVAPHMIDGGWGRIVNIAGLNARQANSIAGSIRNVSVAAMTKNLADELGPAGVGVTVVHPGITVTERTPTLLADLAAREGSTADQIADQLGAATSIGRLVTAAEVADVVVFLCSPRSVAVTGDAVAVGGGARGAIYY
jgi:NAD(P)-dependent dehydrogenase (short-subunit alcohol dehydrogenase family)